MADDNVIQCPTCGKKFKLPARPPATFACTQCATVMDLSGFRTEEAAAPAPSGRAGSGRAGGGGGGGSGRVGGRTSGGAAAARARRARAQAAGDDDEEGGGRGGLPPKKNNNAILWGSFAGMVVVLFLALVLLNKKKVDEVSKKPPAGPGTAAAEEPAAPHTPAAMGSTPPPPGTGMDGTAPVEPGAPLADAGGMESPAAMEDGAPSEPSGPYVNPSKVTFAALGHHPESSAEDKARIDELVQKAVFENAGRDSRDAGHELVSKYGLKAAPRLINVFATVSMGEGFGDIQGRMKCGVADAILRRIDGYIERKKSPRVTPIKATSDAKWVEKVARYWTAWWLNGEWKTPNKPWDDRVDGNREDAADKPGGGAPAGMGGDGAEGGGDK